MCLVCLSKQPHSAVENRKGLDEMLQSEDRVKKAILNCFRHKSSLHFPDGKHLKLNEAQANEILEKADAVLWTGVDLSFDIWAVQWPRDYQPITFA